MTTDLFLPVKVIGEPIVREKDGLAMSSRNAYLSADERKRALCLSTALRVAEAAFASGERGVGKIETLARAEVEKGADTIDYVSCVEADSLAKIETIRAKAVVAIACRVGKTRLIDNFVLGEDDARTLRPSS
jgi:pantoate--beta-alanine ligase